MLDAVVHHADLRLQVVVDPVLAADGLDRLGLLVTLLVGAAALLRAGLRIESFEEYPFLSWRFFPWMEQGADGWCRLPADSRLPQGPGSLPLMFSLKATLGATA